MLTLLLNGHVSFSYFLQLCNYSVLFIVDDNSLNNILNWKIVFFPLDAVIRWIEIFIKPVTRYVTLQGSTHR